MKNYNHTCICKQCGKTFYGRGTLCRKHSTQLSIYGKFLDSNPRSAKDPNEIIIYESYAEIVTYDKDNIENYRFKIDIDDVLFASKYKWCSFKSKKDSNLIYLYNNKIGLFHNYLLGAKKGQTVDHIDGNTFNNCKSNLRIATYSEQNHNQKVRDNIKFDIKGIDKHKDINRKKCYMARFSINHKTYRSPWYETYEEAVFARFLLEQLSSVKVLNGCMSVYINKLSDSKKQPIIKWFQNRFKNRV